MQQQLPCAVCGRVPTTLVTLRRYTGLVFILYWYMVRAPLCREHAPGIAWRWLLRTMVFGWWGFISAILNVFAVVIDVVALIKAYSIGPPRHLVVQPAQVPAGRIDAGWQGYAPAAGGGQMHSSAFEMLEPRRESTPMWAHGLSLLGGAVLVAAIIGSLLNLSQPNVRVTAQMTGGWIGDYNAFIVNEGQEPVTVKCSVSGRHPEFDTVVAADRFTTGPIGAGETMTFHGQLRLVAPTGEEWVSIITELETDCSASTLG